MAMWDCEMLDNRKKAKLIKEENDRLNEIEKTLNRILDTRDDDISDIYNKIVEKGMVYNNKADDDTVVLVFTKSEFKSFCHSIASVQSTGQLLESMFMGLE